MNLLIRRWTNLLMQYFSQKTKLKAGAIFTNQIHQSLYFTNLENKNPWKGAGDSFYNVQLIHQKIGDVQQKLMII